MTPTDPRPDDDLRALWQRQPRTTDTPSLAETRARAFAFRARTRRRVLAGWVSAAFAIVLLLAQAFNQSDPLLRAGEVSVALGIAFAFALLRHSWPRKLPDEATSAQSVVAFHANAIAKQRRSIALVVAAVMPALAGLSMTLIALWRRDPRPQIVAYAPIVALLVLWAAGYLALHRRRARRLERELDDLDRPSK